MYSYLTNAENGSVHGFNSLFQGHVIFLTVLLKYYMQCLKLELYV